MVATITGFYGWQRARVRVMEMQAIIKALYSMESAKIDPQLVDSFLKGSENTEA